jgi:Nucleoside 2-deoxyribosyltransferase like
MIEIKPPAPIALVPGRPAVFLAGSIEMGAAEDWQGRVASALADLDVTALNPRRDAWDAGWPQDAGFAPFREQVEWELAGQEAADLVAFYFAPDTRAPVTLLELGLAAGRGRAVVCCPEGYWRKGNVDVVCRRYGIPQAPTFDALVALVRSRLAPRPISGDLQPPR